MANFPRRARPAHDRARPVGRRDVDERPRHAAGHPEPIRRALDDGHDRVGGSGPARHHDRVARRPDPGAHDLRDRLRVRGHDGLFRAAAPRLPALLAARADHGHDARRGRLRDLDIPGARDEHPAERLRVVPGILHLRLRGPVRGPVDRHRRRGDRVHHGGPADGCVPRRGHRHLPRRQLPPHGPHRDGARSRGDRRRHRRRRIPAVPGPHRPQPRVHVDG